ncbi:MAG: DNA mismatch repair protein MutS [Candidatus Adiutrix sp.]|jgi:DNA mismatch repair protein MutS|nr:DNA mismatch repair protein MutS [Candidatus Adiutrix sp.]
MSSAAPAATLSPAMQQYVEMKKLHPGAIVFFQMGDFYEMFFEDAETAAPLLDIALTSRSKQGGQPIPMCGVPLSAGLGYANRLNELGCSVVVVNQVGDTGKARGLAERVVWQVGTPGLPLTDESRAPGEPHYLAAIWPAPGRYGLAWLEVSTGELLLATFDELEGLRAELRALAPRECLLPENPAPELTALLQEGQIHATPRRAETMNPAAALIRFNQLFGPAAVAALELERWPETLAAAEAALAYAEECCLGDFRHLSPPRLLWRESHLLLDEAATANLEILKTLRHGQLEGSLLGLMDLTATPMGGRLLRQWLTLPLAEAQAVAARHGAVEDLLRDGLTRDGLTGLLKKSSDLERALSRVVLARGGPRDLANLRDTLALMPAYRARLTSPGSSALLMALGNALPEFDELTATLEATLVESPPYSAKDGGLIRRGVSAELDELLDLEKGGKNAIAALEARERQRTGISSLKVGYTRVFGYYLEATKANLHLVPPDWIRKQTIAGGERYLTPELKEYEEKILHAGERRLALEEQILEDLKALVARNARTIKTAALILAEADVLCALAACAEKYGWVRPELVEEDLIDIRGGRHPVVEALMPAGEAFVANDVRLTTRERLLIITGPNMAGKSTILRQTALIVLMCQAGSFVPAESARLSIRDRIFTRVGASDDLARGRSTFMVEMNETARILSQATPRSLVVLDEVGRGTSTYDGLSLAWAIAEYLHDLAGDGVPTLFATHYHELIKLADSKPRVRNYNVAASDQGGRGLIFTRQLKPGGVSRSYGLAVAGLAGLPKKVLSRAREVMADFTRAGDRAIRPSVRQLSLFDDLEDQPVAPAAPPEVIRRLAEIKAEELTPLAALNLLTALTEEARSFLSENE